MIIENTAPEAAEMATKFNQLADNVSKLNDLGTSNSAQLFLVLRRLKYIEAYLQKRNQKYMPFDEDKDEASVFVKQVFNNEIDLDEIDPDKRTVQ